MAGHRFTQVVRFADLDPYNHVNHARYLTYFETARIELLDEIGFGMEHMRDGGIQIVIVEATVSFHAAAGLHDILEITTAVQDVGRVTTTWRQRAARNGDRIVTGVLTAAFTDASGRPRRVPPDFADAVRRFA